MFTVRRGDGAEVLDGVPHGAHYAPKAHDALPLSLCSSAFLKQRVTLVVSLRVPDGIVIAADSLATVPGSKVLRLAQKEICPECAQENVWEHLEDRLVARVQCAHCAAPLDLDGIAIPPATYTQSTGSYAQKVFPFLGRFGIGIFGSSILGTKTVVNHLKGFERTLKAEGSFVGGAGVSDVAKRLYAFLSDRFNEVYPEREHLTAQVLGLQIVGFDSNDDATGKTYVASWGASATLECDEGLFPTYSGDPRIADGLGEVLTHYKMDPNPSVFSLQDAVDYAEFLINLTSTAQRFALMIPTVGGEVDVALVTPYAGFQWIKVKALTRQLEQPTGLEVQ